VKIHSFLSRGWGHDFLVHAVEGDGKKLRISGWCRGIAEGDIVVLPHGSDKAEAVSAGVGAGRYRVESIRYCRDPRDQFFSALTFVGVQGG
jgi:hypothetical protein